MRAVAAVVMVFGACAWAGETPPQTPGDQLLADYFRAQVAEISSKCLADIETREQWASRREQYRRQLAEMLGLWPMPRRTDLMATITGRVEHPRFFVEKLHYQSLPGLYVTGNLYLPKGLTSPAPAILYVCGHGNVKKNGVSYGAKAVYEHHGSWFARNGYVCLIIDTIQLGELEGIHHGTYREKMWWWHSRGYVPSGVETWNGIRAIDYLQSRQEVDRDRIGLTGRSGGGAHTWWIAALDDRIRAAVPVAGITDLQNHVVDGVIEGHCDCMFMVNTYRWDFAQVAAMLAPRPLLIANSDKDTIFQLDGVQRIHAAVRHIYRLHNAADKLGLLITEGPHKDTQELQLPTFRWFNRWLRNDDSLIELPATKLFQPEQLKVFEQLPPDQITTRIQETFVPIAPPPGIPASADAWRSLRQSKLKALREQCFGGWPDQPVSADIKELSSIEQSGVRLTAFELESQPHVPLRLWIARPIDGAKPRRIELRVLDEQSPERFVHGEEPDFSMLCALLQSGPRAVAWIAPRGIGPGAWSGNERRQTHILRRFALVGQTLDGMRVWDIRRAVQALRSHDAFKEVPIALRGERQMAVLAAYASLFEPGIASLELHEPTISHMDGPHLLNVLKVMDIPLAIALAADRCDVLIHSGNPSAWEYPQRVAQSLAWPPGRLRVVGK